MLNLRIKKTLLEILICVFVVTAALLVFVGCSSEYKNIGFQPVTVYQNESSYKSPSGLSVVDGSIYVSDATANKIYKMNDEGVIIKTHLFETTVNSVYTSGANVYALVGERAGEVYLFDANLKLIKKVDAEHSPTAAIVVGDNLYVLNRYSNSMSVYTKDLTPVKTIKLAGGREPMAIEYAQGKLFVACHLPSGAANEEVVSANLLVVDPHTMSVTKTIELLNGTGSVKDIAVSSNGEYIYLANIFAKYTFPTSQLDRGWINTNGVTIVNAATENVYAGVLLDEVENGAANPWGIDVIGAGATAKIVCAISGLGEISIIDEAGMFSKLSEVETGALGYSISETVDHAEFLKSVARRVFVGGEGLRQIQLVAEQQIEYAYLTQYFSGAIVKVPLVANSDGERAIKQYLIGEQGAETKERIGEILWYDGTNCYQKWESCATCHPDARVDGFNWDNLNDGLGNSKSAKSMLYSHRTPPVMVTGARDTAEMAVQKGMEFIQFNTMSDEYLDCINSFLKALKPMQSPYLNRDGTLTESAKNGKKLFNDLSCNTCHSGPNFTDMQMYDSANTQNTDDTWESRKFDTPTLVEIWRSGPWLFNGSAETMPNAIKTVMGKNANITAQQLEDLSNYVLSIGDEEEYYGVEQVFFDRVDSKALAVNLLVPGRIMNKITIRKQQETSQKAFVEIKLFDNNGKQINNAVYAVLTDMRVGDYATFAFNLKVPADLPKGSYYTVKITDADKTSKNLATLYKVFYK